MMSPGPFHPMMLRVRLGPKNGPGLQGKEDDCGVVILYTPVASPQGLRKRSCHVDPESVGRWSRMRGQWRNLRRGRSSRGRSLRGICSSRPPSQGPMGHQFAPPQHLHHIIKQMACDMQQPWLRHTDAAPWQPHAHVEIT